MANLTPFNGGSANRMSDYEALRAYDNNQIKENSWVKDAGDFMHAALGLKDTENPLSFFTGERDFNRSMDMLDREFQLNKELALSAQQFNADQASITRDYNALEASKQRAFEASEAAKSRDFNSLEARLNREWQEKMSNSAIQRATADYRAAGLNPYLAYSQGGAPVTSGSSATSSAPTGGTASAYAASVNPSSVRGSLGRGNKMTELFGAILNTALSFSKIGATVAAMNANKKPLLTEKVFTYDRRGRRTSEYWQYS